jgi:hypothetical protein
MGIVERLVQMAKSAIFNRMGMNGSGARGGRSVRPASEDPYGDPADQMPRSGVRDTGRFGNVKPASQDPLGDPADQMRGSSKSP